jgi:CRISPR-associated endoribonuclease Cas6
MPYALVLHCVPLPQTPSQDDLQGQKGHALFLQSLIGSYRPDVAEKLHDQRPTKSFTTAIMPPPDTRRGHTRLRVQSTGEVTFRITLLDDALFPIVSQIFLRDLHHPPQFRLGKTMLTVTRMLATPDCGEPWVGFAPFDDLLRSTPDVDTSWRLHFATPTVFKTGDVDTPLPLPRLCFQSWLQSWDTHAPQPFFTSAAERRDFLNDVVERYVSVTYDHLRMERQAFYFDGAKSGASGFVGTCRFQARAAKLDTKYLPILTTLIRYSYFAGTGRKTTMGMGMTRPLQQEMAHGQPPAARRA